MPTTAVRKPQTLERVIEGPAAWPATPLRQDDWLVTIPREALLEIDATGRYLARNRLPTLVLDPMHFDMPRCAEMMRQVQRILDAGARFAVLDRLPVEKLGRAQAMQVYWLLSAMMAPPVAQKLDGTILFDVADTGLAATPGSGIRPAQTNAEQSIHNDNAFGVMPPDYVALLCLQPALEGGISKAVSFYTVHNLLLHQHPELLRRLYENFPHDRQREHPPDEDPILWAPVFVYEDNELLARFGPHQINGGMVILGRDTDPDARRALDTIRAVCNSNEITLSFRMEQGHIQYVNNRQIGHSRTAFRDGDTPEQKRHLLRLWLRKRGGRDYAGAMPANRSGR